LHRLKHYLNRCSWDKKLFYNYEISGGGGCVSDWCATDSLGVILVGALVLYSVFVGVQAWLDWFLPWAVVVSVFGGYVVLY
jgi:hypothetical protein